MLMIYSVVNGLNYFCMWVMRLVYLNVFWILFFFVGLVVFGLMFVIVVMFIVVREWVKGNIDVLVFFVFFWMFKKEWWVL